MRRQRFRDPPPLPPDAPAWSCPAAEREGWENQRIAHLELREFDRLPTEVRVIDTAIRNARVSAGLWKRGIRGFDEAERIMREEFLPRMTPRN